MVSRKLLVGLCLVAGFGGGCTQPSPYEPDPAAKFEEEHTTTYDDFVKIRGRTVLLSVKVWKDEKAPAKKEVAVLAISVDGRPISFHSTTFAKQPTVVGDRITFGGHVFALTATPGHYVVDGKPLDLPAEGPRVGYVFRDGVYLGTQSF